VPNAIAIIPARFDSKRFPGKALALIDGVPLVVRVLQMAKQSHLLTDVFVATDDHRIADVVQQHKGNVYFNSFRHETGSDRIAEAAADFEADYILNIQGDEPFLSGDIIDAVIGALDNPEVVMSSACSPLTTIGDADNPNVVKVVLDTSGDALYFSRSRIPYQRADAAAAVGLYRHIGIYGFKRDFLMKFASWGRTPLEVCESLEQLRTLEHGYKIRVVVVKSDFVGIDSPEDLARAEEILNKRGKADDRE
jgi:3-deoxy-manno-octulosonate cytidylyltransferase (CMP-KDO synthetase)